jgi:peptidoglycan/xylan/chitin deacetylase (PgdA/CDA1 family)
MMIEPLREQTRVAGPPFRGHGIRPSEAPWTLMYHSVDSCQEDPYQLTVTPARFARQMQWLHRRGLRGVSMSELLRAHDLGRSAGLVGLTFDDGYADFPGKVLPVLDHYRFTATAYVVAGLAGSHNTWDGDAPRKPLMTSEQIRAMSRRGVEIGSHGLNHRRLQGLSRTELLLETRRSRELLEELLDRPVTGFCYPYGALDAQAVAAVRDSGYSHGVAIAHSELTGRWALPRCYVGEHDGPWRLRAKQVRHRIRALRSTGPADREGTA